MHRMTARTITNTWEGQLSRVTTDGGWRATRKTRAYAPEGKGDAVPDESPEGFATGAELLAIKHFPTAKMALYDLTSLFITGPLKKEARRPEVRAAVAATAQIGKDLPREP